MLACVDACKANKKPKECHCVPQLFNYSSCMKTWFRSPLQKVYPLLPTHHNIYTEGLCKFLKETVSQDFLLQVFFINHLPPKPLKITLGLFKFFENSLRYLQVKVHHRYQSMTHPVKFATDTAGDVNTCGSP
jgi:hypothetical protein